jgi:hypothetical protein
MTSISNISICLITKNIYRYSYVKTRNINALKEKLCCVDAFFVFIKRKIPNIGLYIEIKT